MTYRKIDHAERACAVCGESFKPKLSAQKTCGPKCAVVARRNRINRYRRDRRQEAAAETAAEVGALDYILSDVIFSGAIGDEIAKLKTTPKTTCAAVQARLDAELATICVWPTHKAGRLALLHYIIASNFPHRLSFRHPHEKSKPPHILSGLSIRKGIRR